MKALFALALIAAPAAAQDVPARIDASLALRDRWQWLTRDITEPAQWDEDGRHFHYRKTVEGGFAFIEVDAASLAKSPAFDAAAIAAALTRAGGLPIDPLRLPFDRFAYVEGRRAIEMPVGEVRIRCTLVQPVCARLPDPTPQRERGFGVVRDLRQPADNTPRRSPDGRWEALVVEDNLVVRAAGGGAEKWRAQDGSPGDFHDPETIAWSPDSRHIAVYRVRPGYPRMVTRIVAAPRGRVQPEVVQQLYPKPGDTVDREQPVLFDVATGGHTDIADTLFPNAYTLSAPYWRGDGRTMAFDYVRRGFGAARRIAVDAATAKAHIAANDESKTFVFRDRIFTQDIGKDGAELIQTSERDGWRHLYLIDGRTGRVKRQITRGHWLVRDIAKVDEDKRRIWFSASGYVPGEDPYYKHWFRVDFDGRNLTRLTTADATHEVRFAPDMATYVDTYSRSDLPETSELHGSDGRLIAVLERGDIARLTAAGYRPPERFVAKGRDGTTDIYGIVVRPQDYDPARRYPVIENIYAGPHDSFVPKGFWPFGNYSGGDKVVGMQAQADLGFIVVMIDGMGTANRSKAFHDVAWKNLADSGFPDRIAWLRALAAKDTGVDLSRVGIYGGSAGGQSTLNALLFHGDFYKAGVAYAGCFDNRMDKIDWNEQWLGWPLDASYLAGSGVVHAAKLKGDLLLVVGEQDSNVDPASTTQVVDALVRSGKRFDLLVIPNGEHGAGRSTGPVAYAMRRQYDFFLRSLRGEGVTDWNAR